MARLGSVPVGRDAGTAVAGPLPPRRRSPTARIRCGANHRPDRRHCSVPRCRRRPRAMLLGAGELGKEVIIAFQRLGVEVIAVDRYADAPGHQVAHHAEVVNMTDPAALRAVIDKYQPDHVVPEIEAIATSARCRGGRPTVSPRSSRRRRPPWATMDREGIRRLADEGVGLPMSPYLFADTLEELTVAAEQVGYPCGQAGDVVVGQAE